MVLTRAQSLLALKNQRASTINQTSSHQDLPAPVQNRGRKRKQSIENALEPGPGPAPKKQRKRKQSIENALEPGPGPAPKQQRKHVDPIAFWVEHGHFPEEQDWPEETSEMESYRALLPRRISPPRNRPNSLNTTTAPNTITTTEPGPKGDYRKRLFLTILESNCSYMNEDELGLASASSDLCRTLLENPQPIPSDTLFRDDAFRTTCLNLRDKNEARVVQDIGALIVPRAETLCTLGAKHLAVLTESVHEGWSCAYPLCNPRPQPDYAVGFKRKAFTKDQLDKLSPFIGKRLDEELSLFLATRYMYFPFLTCEVKYGIAGFEIADRQNAHSMTLAVRAIVSLFRCLKREDEVNRQILAFSISHNEDSVKIYGHYPVINGKDTEYYRYPIESVDFTIADGKNKWTAYRFTRNVYDIWMPAHLKKICSAIDQLPSDLDFDAPPLFGDFGNLISDAGPASESVEQDSRSSNAEQQGVTLDTSLTRPEARPKAAKRRKGQV